MPIPVKPESLPSRRDSGYPQCFRDRVLPRDKRALGDAFGLTRIGVNQTTLPSGKSSALRHAHSDEDELVYVLHGELILINDDGEHPLSAGMTVGFPAGDGNAHHLQNRSSEPAIYLEISNRSERDQVEYPDDDLMLTGADAEGMRRFLHKDGTIWD